MKKIFLYSAVFSLLSSSVYAREDGSTPKEPAQVPAATAQSYINNYKTNTLNFFAHGYLLDIARTAAMSATGVRVYNGLEGDNQRMVMAPLDGNFAVNGGGQCYMQSDERLCPKYCDIVGMEPAMQISSSDVTKNVNYCIDCRKYESANAFNVFSKTLNSLAGAGFKYVRIYNGMDASKRRYVIYIPVDASGKEVQLEQVYVGDESSVLINAKYPK